MTPEPFVVVPGNNRCPHVDTQLLKYRSPMHESRVWSCPSCHLVVRQDVPAGAGDWTAPVVEMPEGLEGKPIPGTDRRGWGMPQYAKPVQPKSRFGIPSRAR